MVIDKSSCELWASVEEQSGKNFQAIFDANGTSTLNESYNHLGAGGRLIVYGRS